MRMARLANPESPIEALRRAVTTIGSQSATGRLLNVTQATVSKWLSKSQMLPPEHVLVVEAATGISRHDLRPDIYPRESLPAPAADATGFAAMDPAR